MNRYFRKSMLKVGCKIHPMTSYLRLTYSILHYLTSSGILRDKTLKVIHQKIHLRILPMRTICLHLTCSIHHYLTSNEILRGRIH